MKIIDLLDKYLITRDNFKELQQAMKNVIPTQAYNEAYEHILKEAQQTREELNAVLTELEKIADYLRDEEDGKD